MSISSDKTLEGLFQFIKDQPPEKRIDHSSFSNCAIGEYTRSGIDSFGWAYDNIPDDVALRAGFFMLVGGMYMDGGWVAPDTYTRAKTYGELQQIIKDYETRTRSTNTGELGSSRWRVQEDTVPSVHGERREIA